jgi:hypothetical protein
MFHLTLVSWLAEFGLSKTSESTLVQTASILRWIKIDSYHEALKTVCTGNQKPRPPQNTTFKSFITRASKPEIICSNLTKHKKKNSYQATKAKKERNMWVKTFAIAYRTNKFHQYSFICSAEE